MIVEITHSGFRMRDDTEHVLYSIGAEQFFIDYGIPYTVDKVGDNYAIRYHQDSRMVDLRALTIEDLLSMATIYDMAIQIGPVGIHTIKFKGNLRHE